MVYTPMSLSATTHHGLVGCFDKMYWLRSRDLPVVSSNKGDPPVYIVSFASPYLFTVFLFLSNHAWILSVSGFTSRFRHVVGPALTVRVYSVPATTCVLALDTETTWKRYVVSSLALMTAIPSCGCNDSLVRRVCSMCTPSNWFLYT